MLTYSISAICGLLIFFTLGYVIMLGLEALHNFHHRGMERVKRYNRTH